MPYTTVDGSIREYKFKFINIITNLNPCALVYENTLHVEIEEIEQAAREGKPVLFLYYHFIYLTLYIPLKFIFTFLLHFIPSFIHRFKFC